MSETKATVISVLKDKLVKSLEEDFWEHFHRLLLAATFVAGVLAVLLESHNPDLSLKIVLGTIVSNILLLGLRSRFEQDEDLSLFYTFWMDYLKPPKRPRRELEIAIDIAILEEKGKERFKDLLASRFKPKPKDNTEKNLSIRWKPISWSAQNKDLNDKRFKRIRRQFKTKLKKSLFRSEAVAFVRIDDTDQNSWVRETINSWASKNASVPVLAVVPEKEEEGVEAQQRTEQQFLSINDNPRVFPWGLLRRSLDRASAWRSQARYNRAMAFNILLLLLMVIIVGYLSRNQAREEHETASKRAEENLATEYKTKVEGLFEGMRIRSGSTHDKPIVQLISEYEAAMKGMHEALETKMRFQKDVLKYNDNNLHVSYWIRSNDKPYVFVTTETELTKNFFETNKTSLIGCGYAEPNRILQWDTGNPQVFDFSTDKEITEHGCQLGDRVETIKSIACSAFLPSETSDHDATVGICIFTGSNKSILGNGVRDFLKTRTREFSNSFRSSIKEKTVSTLYERLIKENEARNRR